MLKLFRVLLPSWKFFDGTSDAPELYYRIQNETQNFGDWILCIPKTGERDLKRLFINSRENFLFASHALLEYLKNDLDEKALDPKKDASVSLELISNLVRYQIVENGKPTSAFQFKVTSYADPSKTLYTSETMAVLT